MSQRPPIVKRNRNPEVQQEPDANTIYPRGWGRFKLCVLSASAVIKNKVNAGYSNFQYAINYE